MSNMECVYILDVDLNSKKVVNEMEALELENINDIIQWIVGNLDCDSDYYQTFIAYNINRIPRGRNKNDLLTLYVNTIVDTVKNGDVELEMKYIIESDFGIICNILSKTDIGGE